MLISSTNGQNASALASGKNANALALGRNACMPRVLQSRRGSLWSGQNPKVRCSPAVADLRLAVLVADLAHGVKGHHTQESTLQ